MSHYTVLVIGDVVDKALAPFHEFECTGINDEYVVSVDTTDEVSQQIASSGLSEGLAYYGLENRVVTSESEVDTEGAHKYGYAVVQGGKLIKSVKRTNPNAKWDWYTVGGRWEGFLLLKDGKEVNSARVGDIDWEAQIRDGTKEAETEYDQIMGIIDGRHVITWEEFWVKVRDGSMTIDEARKAYHQQGPMTDLRKEYPPISTGLLEEVHAAKSRVEYARQKGLQRIATWAILQDGNWIERGSMGWFGTSDATKESRQTFAEKFYQIVTSLPPETVVTVVDCHI